MKTSLNGAHPAAARMGALLLPLALLAVLLTGPGRALAADKADKAARPERPEAPRPALAPGEVYKLQPGDEIAVSVTPRKEFDCEAILSPDGMLYLKSIGTLKAAGLTVPELTEQIRAVLAKQLRKPRVTVTLLKIAPPPLVVLPKVTVGGAVAKPGPLDLEEGLRVRKALELAGGPNKDADLSNITIVHKDLTKTVVDLSTVERVTNAAHNRLLQPGDSVDVPSLLKKSVTVGGAVAKPGPIDLESGLRVKKLIDLAGGVGKDADLSRVTIVHGDLTRTVVDLSTAERVSDPAHNLLLADGDSVEVPLLFKSGTVSIDGAVQNPSTVDLKPGMALEDLILAAGKLTTLADVEHVQLRRAGQPVRTINLMEEQKQGVGRVLLEPGDSVHVSEQNNRVLLLGALDKPGFRPFEPGTKLRDFLTDGSLDSANALDGSKVDLKNVQIIRKGQPTVKVNVNQVLKNEKDKGNVALQSGDVLFLPARDTTVKASPLEKAFPLLSLLSVFTGL
jgi:polysaccharide export outer membrane protein